MTISTKDEIVGTIAQAICDSHPFTSTKWNEVVRLSQIDGYIVAKDIVRNTRIQAEAALQAVLKLLPVMPMDLVNGIDTDARSYNQLLRMRD